MDIAILLYDGFDEMDAIGPFEIFENAERVGAAMTTTLRTVEERERVTASHGLDVGVDGRLADTDPDLLLVPGGGWANRSESGAWAEAERGVIPDAIAAHFAGGGQVAGVCTGGMLLARAGVLDGRPAVTHASALDELRETDAEAVDARVVDDGDVLTAGGVTSGLDLAIHVVEREAGAAVADEVLTLMEYEPRGRVHQP